GFRIDPDLGNPSEILEIVAASILPKATDLHQKLTVFGELQDVRILLAIAADPNVALIVDVDAVIGLRPLVTLTWAAPRFYQRPLRIALPHWGRRAAAIGDRRIELRPFFIIVQRRRAPVDDPHVVLPDDRHTDRQAKRPAERLRPERLPPEHWSLRVRALRLR